MRKPDPLQEALISADEVRHPMWTAPDKGDVSIYPHVHALRTKMASTITPLDGRHDVEIVLMYAQEVWQESEDDRASDPYWLLGRVQHTKAGLVKRLTEFLGACQPANAHLYRRDIGMVQRHADEYTNAIANALV